MQTPGQALARTLKRRRLERDLSISELARQAGIAKATLAGIERGSGNPSIDTAWALARALNVPFGDLFDGFGMFGDGAPACQRLIHAAFAPRWIVVIAIGQDRELSSDGRTAEVC